MLHFWFWAVPRGPPSSETPSNSIRPSGLETYNFQLIPWFKICAPAPAIRTPAEGRRCTYPACLSRAGRCWASRKEGTTHRGKALATRPKGLSTAARPQRP